MPFAAVSLCVSAWFLLEAAYDAAAFDGVGDLPRIHERYLIYLAPLFIVATLAVVRVPMIGVTPDLFRAMGTTA